MKNTTFKLIVSEPSIDVPDTGYLTTESSSATSTEQLLPAILALILASIIIAMIIRYRKKAKKGLEIKASNSTTVFHSLLLVVALSGLTFCASSIYSAVAASIDFTTKSTLEVPAILDMTNTVKACGTDEIKISQALPAGYKLKMSGTPLALEDGTSIGTIADDGFADGTWAFTTNEEGGFLPIPSDMTLIKSTTESATDDTTVIKYCAMLGPDTKPGTYTGTISYEVEANPSSNPDPSPNPNPNPNPDQNAPTASDTFVIPDKYNTGNLKGVPLTKFVQGETTIDGVTTGVSGDTLVVNFLWSGNRHTNVRTIENMDFTNYPSLRFYNGGEQIEGDVIFIFRNCKFNSVGVGWNMWDNVKFYFYDSEFKSFGSSNAEFHRCYFGGGPGDTMNPFKNVAVYNSFFTNNTPLFSDGTHMDGIHTFGSNNSEAATAIIHNLHYYDSRIETPYFLTKKENGEFSTGYVNASIMFAPEYNDANDVIYENMWVNGGGYTIYGGSATNQVTNITMKDIHVGYGHIYGIFYPNRKPENGVVNQINVAHYDKLIAGSVWKEDGKTHVSISNETLIERQLTCKTNHNTYTRTISAHPRITKENASEFTYATLPYDLDTVFDDDATYIQCYDTTAEGAELNEDTLIRTEVF